MSQKKSYAQPSAKLASGSKSSKPAFASMETGRESAEKVVKISSAAMKDFLANSADEAQKAQEKVFAISRESAQNIAKSTDTAGKMLSESVSLSRDNLEACMESANLAASMVKDMSEEVMESLNQAFSGSMELSKEFFACRTLSDMMELNNRIIQQSVENFFNQSSKISSMAFEYAGEAMEPINERLNQAGNQLKKAMSN